MQSFNVLDLFCGAGGLSYGFASAGFNILLGIDNDVPALETFRLNHQGAQTICSDITQLTYKQHIAPVLDGKKIDVIIGGPPCQSFSIVAQNPARLGIKDERGRLFFEMCRILKDKQPRCFIAENVKGILTANQRSTFPLIIREFENSGYDVTYTVLNAAKYGVPQKRECVIIVGFRKDLKIKFKFPPAVIKDESAYVPLAVCDSTNRGREVLFQR